ncbi:MAG: hypothetical protein US05_C0011G0064 [Candidatus Nomurabacteria bacterium GW2011_GWA1_36_15]|uniref:YqgF/RNase H-like domain-containing protein n=1 Tax=Candidatus Nomurabacteria bacterium GW2011_GWA1_36_15 TaxID=1618728 RepID=A0A0G0H1Q1_9BACT|nr:MAG: hypothetical protein US05_C0011G0064 [Candidatus Nomurabacteria bacterium GW2011_GWA1_36_15]
MKFLGIDYGTKRIGVAISDEKKVLAFPKEIVLNDSSSLKKLEEIIKTENISEIIIGESIDFSGKLNALSARIEVFILELKKQVHSRLKQIKSGRVDASAAALILQRYLDKKNNGK